MTKQHTTPSPIVASQVEHPHGRPVMIVLGGNAFARPRKQLTMDDQFNFAKSALQHLTPVLSTSAPLMITHGNGPQVGLMLARVEAALGQAYRTPLEVCVAETEGELGYVLQQSLHNILAQSYRTRPVVSLLTQVVVDPEDRAFQHPTKPIGPAYSTEQAVQLKANGFDIVEQPGRGFRRVVPSPLPREIVEQPVITRLLDEGVVVIAGGGGGIPVTRQDDQLVGVEAVIDKDRTSAILGESIDAWRMIIVTDVACAYRSFRTSNQQAIGNITPDELHRLMEQGHFAPGTMHPKVEAAIRFCRRPNTEAVICSLMNLDAALRGESGTIVRSEEFEEGYSGH